MASPANLFYQWAVVVEQHWASWAVAEARQRSQSIRAERVLQLSQCVKPKAHIRLQAAKLGNFYQRESLHNFQEERVFPV
jgi:hypothetical protein